MGSKSSNAAKAQGGRPPIGQIIGETTEELKRVSTPTRQEVLQATIVVLFLLVFISLFLGALDLLFQTVMEQVIG